MLLHSSSSSSLSSSGVLNGSSYPSLSRSSSASSMRSYKERLRHIVLPQDGLAHADKVLEARKYKNPTFIEKLLHILAILNVPTWNGPVDPAAVDIFKVSGSLTNAVFFVRHPACRTLLLRIYGASSGEMISRPDELHILHVLSSEYRIGPRLYGTFANGRIEEWFDARALTAQELRDPQVSTWIGARMAGLHRVDVTRVVGDEAAGSVVVNRNVRKWLVPAREVMALVLDEVLRRELDLPRFEREWEMYWQWLMQWEKHHGEAPRVFSHNDTQYGNLLRLARPPVGKPAHHQLIVVDFEYAAPNPAAFDVANHFHEWTADYHSDTPHVLRPALYPTLGERQRFYQAYLSALHNRPGEVGAAELDRLEAEVRVWSPASHGMWATWGVVQAREDVLAAREDANAVPEFDYLGYTRCRIESFRRECQALGVW